MERFETRNFNPTAGDYYDKVDQWLNGFLKPIKQRCFYDVEVIGYAMSQYLLTITVKVTEHPELESMWMGKKFSEMNDSDWEQMKNHYKIGEEE